MAIYFGNYLDRVIYENKLPLVSEGVEVHVFSASSVLICFIVVPRETPAASSEKRCDY